MVQKPCILAVRVRFETKEDFAAYVLDGVPWRTVKILLGSGGEVELDETHGGVCVRQQGVTVFLGKNG